MRRVLPYPLISLLLLVMWLILNQSVSPGQILIGGICALLGPLVLTRLDVPPLRLRRPWAMLRLIGRTLVDIVRSNMNVARAILNPKPTRRAGFVAIPLALRSPYGFATLACILTATPGTAWVSLDPADGTLIIHVLDLYDDDDWGAIIKNRYEGLLMEIFE
ncbi:MAG: Na+/H+ antiporter subunit E [Chelatococcus sp.]|jgi:multicomponent K+:H+ antiporter subunit E|uniref:Na+/H+ antiporter subunit E n=1 Tax=unclassified Chelatococcus TaxID=2638111 RepID=UPI001BCCCE22|nr:MULTISPECIES: Na+/H+ antiporter subunit E [unclassified Chelatococcus]CAH1651314.1 putative K(+)/H(+) antiporter subunit E [Hyphomicrobiales bacterium]MBS7739842.1 Na+/H+ antiporter subunit E [Chelatococcus sp. HY11]MBX3536811.1 Na+/H+ antiporter subunit E [Chelatococcus sp.]MBX3545486.1 Na+/H+ antiporter subunit E [Chelatococcus sp.]MCO5078859.1 Na+/H+ antiporter subunit E [Chelatococcus sp.]